MILVIDNYDSFTYNLVQFLGELGADPIVLRNDEATVETVESLKPGKIVISPGPKTPKEAGETCSVVTRFMEHTPILGVCLGHQCIGAATGGEISLAPQLMHGKTSEISHDGSELYAGLPSPFTATRYHSLIISEDSLNEKLTVTCRSDDGLIMGIRHRDYPLHGLQFHPESILTNHIATAECPEGFGKRILKNFLEI